MSAAKNDIIVLECTLRDGSYAIDFQFTAEDTYVLCQAMEKAGFRWIEVGHGVGLGASGPQHGVAACTDEEYLDAASRALNHARFGAFFIPGLGTKRHLDMARHYGMGFVRVGTNITHSEEAHEYIAYAKNLGMIVSYNAMKSYVVTPEEFIERTKPMVDLGVDIVQLVDSAGGMLPSEVTHYTELMRASLPVRIGFHGHNNFMLANANNLAALAAGATVLDSTLQSMGRGAGNAQTEIMLVLYEKLGIPTGIDIVETMNIGERLVRIRMKEGHGVTALEVISGKAMFHSSYLKRIHDAVQAFNVDEKVLIIEVSRVDKVNPSEELIFQVARELAEGKRIPSD